MSYEGRVANPCIGAERADLVLAGCAILEAIRRAFPCERLRVADRGLREGMLVQMMREDGVWGEPMPRHDCDGERTHGSRSASRTSASRSPRSAGSSASSTIPTWRAPSARAFARARPSSSPRSTTSTICSSPARAWSISAPRPAAGARWRQSASARAGRVVAHRHSRHGRDCRRRIRADRFPRSATRRTGSRPCSAGLPTWCSPTWRRTPPAIARPII